jgi:glycosyltransferase involved in cell wall biosynthesis
MTRFAEKCRVIFVDPPEVSASVAQPQLTEKNAHEDVRVIRPLFPASLISGKHATYEELWLRMLPEVLALAGPNTVLWVSSPLADYLVNAAQPHILFAVYDCMDDLASFRDGTHRMKLQEDALLSHVEIVFTGGRSMYEARKDRHPNVHCFPSGVDIAHYQQVKDAATTEPAGVEHVVHPRLGYFGVLDERIDWPLIGEVASRHPEWQWVLVGPTVKIDPSELAMGPNIHYYGQQPYAVLPAYLKSFDIATMPFALNEATRFISPTKTLEYLAGGKPVISTSVPDVVATYAGTVAIADGAEAWIAAIEELLVEQPSTQRKRYERVQPLLEAGTWDSIAGRMWALMTERVDATESTDATHDDTPEALER